MTPEEQAEILKAAAHCINAAAHLVLVGTVHAEKAVALANQGRELAAFAVEMGKK